ncbi:unnamed protein product [Amaranthus hypochondriacus]
MATSQKILALSRTLFTTKPIKQSLASILLSRTFSSSAKPSSFSLIRLRPLASSIAIFRSSTSVRAFSTQDSQTSLNDNNPNWSNRPPKETILLDGCDFEHWLVVTDNPPENATRDEIIDSYIKTLAQVVGSEEEARMKIYSVSTRHYFAFGALVSEELSYKLKELPNVRWVLPDSYLDVKNKDYGGEPFIDGRAVPYDPKYHEEWVRNNAKAQERNRRNDRPRNADRSRNFDRRQGGSPNYQNPGATNMVGPGTYRPGPPNAGGPPPNMPPNNAGYAQNMPPNNAGFAQNMPPNNARYAQNMPPNNAGYAPNMPHPNAGHAPNMPHQNVGYAPNAPHNNAGYAQNNPGFAQPPPNYRGQGNPGSQTGVGGQPGGTYQPQDVPGRDMPNY